MTNEDVLSIINEGMKICSACGIVKPLTEFFVDKKGNRGVKGTCKTCYSDIRKEANRKNRLSRVSNMLKETEEDKMVVNGDRYSYEDLTLHNYKEPLTSVPEGYGFYGTLTATKDGKYVQCHLCGRLFKSLIGHISSFHKMEIRKYKEDFGLAYTNALISEEERLKNSQRTLEWLRTLTDEQKEEWKSKSRSKQMGSRKKRAEKGQPIETLESKNKKGTCPDQLLAKIIEVKGNIGKTPSKSEFIAECGTQRYVHLIYKLFGSYENAIYMAGLEPSTNTKKGGIKYEDNQLLAYLRSFAEETHRLPTTSDFNRDYLPSIRIYETRFGNLNKAREKAGVYEILGIKPQKGSMQIGD